MKKMIADKAFDYRMISLKPGDEFECEDAHVMVFVLTGQAHEPSDLSPLPSTQQYLTRVLTAAAPGRRRTKDRKPRA